MFVRLFLLFAILPILEIYLFIRIGSLIGALTTIGVIIITAMLGAWLARQQGFQALARIREALSQGRLPADEIVDAFLVFAAGLVLLTPGFITDAAGFLLLIPKARQRIKQRLRDWLKRRMDRGGGSIHIYHR